MTFNLSTSASPFVNVTVNKDAYQEIVTYLTLPQPGSNAIYFSTLYFFLGVLTVLTSIAVFILIRKGMRKWPNRVLLGCTLLMCACTWTQCIVQAVLETDIQNALKISAENLESPTLPLAGEIGHLYGVGPNITATLALIINIIVGDGIVWWRACVVWTGNIPVRITCVIMMLGTTAVSISSLVPIFDSPTQSEFGLYLQNKFGTAAVAFSLATNAVATCLIGFKTWQHWRFMCAHLGKGKAATKTIKVLLFLVESGVLYSVLLSLIMVWQGIITATQSHGTTIQISPALLVLLYVVVGIFMPLIAIYPISIVVLVSLKYSTLENGIKGEAPPGLPSATLCNSTPSNPASTTFIDEGGLMCELPPFMSEKLPGSSGGV